MPSIVAPLYLACQVPVRYDVGMDDADLDRWLPAWMALLRVYPRYFDYVESELRREHGLSMARYDVLAHLDLAGGRLGLSELAARIWLSPSGLSKLLDRMESSGLVARESDPRDARAWFAVLTAGGRSRVRRARQSHHAVLASTLGSALNDRDVADVVRAMKRLGASFGSGDPGSPANRSKDRQTTRRRSISSEPRRVND
jgi:DNA-binding MarR family transcriptional regulator